MTERFTVRDDEQLVVEESPAWTAHGVETVLAGVAFLAGLILLTASLIAGSLLIWLGALLYADTSRRRTRSGTYLTTDRLVATRSRLTDRDRVEVPLDEIREVEAVDGRFTGSLAVTTDGGESAVRIDDLSDPESFEWRVSELQDGP